MKKRLRIICFVLIGIIVMVIIYKLVIIYNRIDILKLEVLNYDENKKNMTINVIRVTNKLNNNFKCFAENENVTLSGIGENNHCHLTLDVLDDYKIFIKNSNNKISNSVYLKDALYKVLSFKFKHDEIYLTVNEEKNLDYDDVVIGNVNYNFKIEDEKIAILENNKIIGLAKGETFLKSDLISEKLKIIVTDLITKPVATKDKKELLKCHAFTEEEANMLDKILAYKVKEGGYQTRAGALAAARFLTLEFPYRVPYFFENGRVNNSGVHLADGEGRYYKDGLYLAESKKEGILYKWRGPAIWGCPLTNLEDKKNYGYIAGKLMPNGLDCSGFITWALKNGGFDPGDVGAGETVDRDNQCTDLGEYTKITPELLNSGKVKVGDLINWWGHIGMIIGIDKDNDKYYVAESLAYIGGVRAMIYSKNSLMNTFTHIILMDRYYQKDGNITNMW